MISPHSLLASAAILIALPALTGCQHSSHVKIISETDNGSTVTLSHHDLLKVRLPGNPSTGFGWQTVKINSWVLAPLGRPAFESGASGTNGAALIGAGGTVELTYETVGSGSSPLELTYSRPWEPETASNKTFKITVNVAQ